LSLFTSFPSREPISFGGFGFDNCVISRGSVLSETRARLLHIYFGHIGVHLLPLIRAWKNPSIVSFHGADVMVDMNKPAYREATLRMLDAVTLVLVRSESLRRAVVDLGCEPEKIEIQRTGIPLEEFPFRDRAVPKNGEWRFVQAGRLIEKKGLPVTLRAFSTFLKKHPNATLTIAGEGPLLPELQRVVGELGITDRVSFTGFVSQEQLREIYYRSHIFLHPSQTGRDGNQEGIPNSMRSDGHRSAGVCHRARRHSRSNREWRERRACARAR
jgi:colanic acid/amylovoran biosynthesis glycosyltransferase